MSLIPVSLSDYERYKAEHPIPSFVMKGLPKGYLGMLIAPPDTGKSHLCLTIAYELSSGLNLLGVRPDSDLPIRTLLWPAEDGVHPTFDRISEHIRALPAEYHDVIRENVSIYESTSPILSAGKANNQADIISSRRELEKLIEHAKNFDLVIIDTIREAIGTATEVDDDVRVKETLKELAQEANVAVLVTHHPTKNVIRGLEDVSTASGSGLSCTVAFARCHFYLKTHKDKNTGENSISLLQPKANFLAYEDRVNKPLVWGSGSLLHAGNADFSSKPTIKNLAETDSRKTVDVSDWDEELERKPRKQPIVIEASIKDVSKESVELAEGARQRRSPISKDLVDRFIKERERKENR